MLRGRVLYLCVVCLLGLPPPPAARPCTTDLILRVQDLLSKAPALKWLDCRLYTPTVQNYQNCPSSTLRCFAGEIKVLVEEWEAVPVQGIRRFKLNMKLESLASQLETQTESECLQCELFKEEEAEKFLQDLKSTLEVMNSQNCSR